MRTITHTTITATISAQIQLFHPDNTAILIDNTSDCYNIFPAIDEVVNANGLKREFYKHSNCGGLKIEEAVEDNVFKVPVRAFSVKVSENRRRFRYLLADWNDTKDDFEDEKGDFNLSEDITQYEDIRLHTKQNILDFEKNIVDWSQGSMEA